MKTKRYVLIAIAAAGAAAGLKAADGAPEGSGPHLVDPRQIEAWSHGSSRGAAGDDLEFFLHGTMSAEFIPERFLRAFESTYPDLFPGGDLSAYGATAERPEDLPPGFSRRVVPHLGGLPSLGINCAACHAGVVQEAPDRPPIRVLGRPSLFNIYAFFGAIAVSLVRASEPNGMAKFLEHYLRAGGADLEAPKLLAKEIERQGEALRAAVAFDPLASKGSAPGELHAIAATELDLDRKRLEGGVDLAALARAILKVFHNMRTALHIPEELPGPVSTLPGPGRTDAFGVLAASFFNFPTKFEAPVKFGIVWNLSGRKWVHWDGNNGQPLARNLGAALGLGAPLVDQGRLVDFKAVERHTKLSELIRSPRWPWAVDREIAARGAARYREHCARCHDAPEEGRLFSIDEVGTDSHRALFFDERQADLLNRWVAALKVEGYSPPAASFRSTKKYWAASMEGVWARSPYLHNGSVRTLRDLLTAPERRPRSFQVGSRLFDLKDVGYQDAGAFNFDTGLPGNSGSGHAYGTDFAESEKRELIEYLKTR
jgi:hypothetical protein